MQILKSIQSEICSEKDVRHSLPWGKSGRCRAATESALAQEIEGISFSEASPTVSRAGAFYLWHNQMKSFLESKDLISMMLIMLPRTWICNSEELSPSRAESQGISLIVRRAWRRAAHLLGNFLWQHGNTASATWNFTMKHCAVPWRLLVQKLSC